MEVEEEENKADKEDREEVDEEEKKGEPTEKDREIVDLSSPSFRVFFPAPNVKPNPVVTFVFLAFGCSRRFSKLQSKSTTSGSEGGSSSVSDSESERRGHGGAHMVGAFMEGTAFGANTLIKEDAGRWWLSCWLKLKAKKSFWRPENLTTHFSSC